MNDHVTVDHSGAHFNIGDHHGTSINVHPTGIDLSHGTATIAGSGTISTHPFPDSSSMHNLSVSAGVNGYISTGGQYGGTVGIGLGFPF